jgi:hypothetical protein
MEIVIKRTYADNGTNGVVSVDGNRVCFCIELPWKENARRVSCIPEGTYELGKRFSNKYKHHIEVLKVPGRQYILIHPANNAATELAGCIAPVSVLTGPGKGLRSRLAFEIIKEAVYAALDKGELVKLIIES